MRNKKGSSTSWILGIVFFAIAIGLIITLVMISNQSVKEQEKIGEKIIKLYLSSKDADLKKSISTDYEIFSSLEEKIISMGKTEKNSFTEIKNISTKDNLTILCGGDLYYKTKIEKRFSEKDIKEEISKVECSLYRIGELELSTQDKLKNGENKLVLDLSSYYTTKRLAFCVSWTAGIISINSEFNITDKPERIKSIVDKCYDLGITLKDEDRSIKINIKANNLTSDDEVKIYFYDQDLRFNPQSKSYEYYSEIDGKNLGFTEDLIITITE